MKDSRTKKKAAQGIKKQMKIDWKKVESPQFFSHTHTHTYTHTHTHTHTHLKLTFVNTMYDNCELHLRIQKVLSEGVNSDYFVS